MPTPKFKLSDIRFDAVLVGAIVDNLGTTAAMLALMTALTSTGISDAEALERIKTLSGLILTLIVGLGWTMLGGYVAGRMAKRDELLHGALVAAVGIVIALIFREEKVPLWFEIAGLVGMLPAGMAGGRQAKQRNKRM